MARRTDPASDVVEYFSTVNLDTAQTVLAIVKRIVAKRQPPKATKPRVVKPRELRETAVS